jgi:hypothetical protein
VLRWTAWPVVRTVDCIEQDVPAQVPEVGRNYIESRRVGRSETSPAGAIAV